jgi:RNA ligase (TIGR02306 family)
MGVDTHKAEVVPVVLEKHPNADKLSIVRVYNFTVVVNTEDWQGVEKAVYIQPDSVLPDKPEYRFLKETGNLRKERDALNDFVRAGVKPDDYDQQLAAIEAKIDANTKYLRITVRKLRGVMSMGMLLPAPEGSNIGDDVAEQLGITHYEPPAMDEIEGSRKHAGSDVAPPPPLIYAPKYDLESVYSFAEAFEPGEMVYISEKIDGQNSRYVTTFDTEPQNFESATALQTHAGSRTEWKKKEGGSNWWRALDQNPWIEKWIQSNSEQVLYGEIFGWVQSLKYGAKQGQLFFRAFDVLRGMEYIDAEEFISVMPEDHRAPSLGIMPFNFEELQKLADGPSLVPGAANMREGIVIKPLRERQHWKLGRVSLKMVSNAYLEKSAR